MAITTDNSNSFCLFWDVDRSKLDINVHKTFIIERVLKYGIIEDVLWLLKTYSEDDLIKTIKSSKNIDRKTANYWALHLGIKKEDVICLNRPLIHEQFY
ncbi:hypothetical protein PITCH_A2030186 [uncultured Desulfobacterium sp.]|uniref:DUF6922 domain-containing protein n=1 Tax=uncultured Desulfobacterium sp. TaxID=201089 RepID=A0A445MXE1_9BACT|nr:hypothetical protein PITCH_A2030186 [uncultured Desulfobacterium sp.]